MAVLTPGTACVLTAILVLSGRCECEFYSIGGIFDDGPPPNAERLIFVQSTIRNNIRSNSSTSSRPFHATARLQHTEITNDAAVLRKMCKLLHYNVSLIVGVVDLGVVNMVATASKKIQLPFITPSFSMKESFPDTVFDYVVSIRPSLVPPLLDLLQYHKWKQFAYIYNGKRGLRRADTLMQIFPRYGYKVVFKHMPLRASKAGTSKRANGGVKKKGSETRTMIEILENMRDSGLHHIIFDLSLAASEKVLRKLQATDLGMVTASYHYIFMDLDIADIDMNQFQLGGLNLTGFQLMDKTSAAYKDFIADWRLYVKNSSYVEVDTNFFHLSNPAIAMDAMDVALEALDLSRGASTQRRDKLLTCNLGMGSTSRPIPNPDGPNLIKDVKKVKLQGLTGNIEFDSQGDRANYTVQILGLRETGLKRVGTWNGQNEKRLTFDTQDDNEISSEQMGGRIYTVTSILSKPFLMLKPDPERKLSGNNRFEGYCIDLLTKIKEVFKNGSFQYKIKLVSDNEYGHETGNGKWNGMIGELIYGKADIAVAPLTINAQREKVIGFTKPFMSLGVSIMIKKPQDNQPSVFTFMQPLAPEIWMSIIFACVIVSVVLFQVSRFNPKEWHRVEHTPTTPSGTEDSFTIPKPGERFVTEDREETENDFGIFNSLWFTIGALMQQGCELCPRSFSGRLTGSVWWFFTLIFVSSYTANLAAFLTAKRMVTPITSASDLVEQTTITYGTRASGSTETFFRTSTVPVYRHMWEFMSNLEDSPFANTTEAGVERVRKSNGKYAFLLESAMNKYFNQQPPCDTMQVGNLLDSKSYGIGVNKQLVDVREHLTLAILELRERAILDQLEKEWWKSDDESCNIPTVPDHKTKTNALTLDALAGIFYILLCGLAVALLVAGGNLGWRSRHELTEVKNCYLKKRKEGVPDSKKSLPTNAETNKTSGVSHTPV